MRRFSGRTMMPVSGTSKLLVALSCVLGVLGARLESQTPPGTVIRNSATVTYQASTGASFAPVSDSALVTVGSVSGIAVTLVKSADRVNGTLGDIVTYRIAYQGLGAATATNVVIGDVLPAGAVYVPASITLHGASLSDAADADAGAFNAASRRVSVTIATVTGTDSGTVSFRARLDGTASPSNIARVNYLTPLGADSAASNAVQTTLLFASISVAKLLDAPPSPPSPPLAPAIARVGDAVLYRVRYDNPASGVIARNVVVTDTLPTGLQYVGANPPAAVSGSVLTWTLGDVAAGTTADITLQTRVAVSLPDSVTVLNRVALTLDNGQAATAAAPAVLLLLSSTGQLSLAKAADLLEAGLGETVPYTLTVQNTGTTALGDIRISDRLPEGGRYAKGSALGVDSVSANGRDLVFYHAGPLAAGATYRVRYQVAIVSAESDVLQNTAVATAEAGAVQSAPATAWVRIRKSWPLETRAAIGKVFVDANHNGQQDGDEAGVAGVDVWTDDGEIATTDAEGRFSFQNLRPGRHVYRVDPATLPAGFSVPNIAQFVARDGSGWTSPRVDFGLETAGRTAAAAVHNNGGQAAKAAVGAVTAASASASATAAVSTAAVSTAAVSTAAVSTAASPCGDLSGVLPGGYGDRATIAYFNTNESRPHYVLSVDEIGARVQALLRGRPGCSVDIIGYTDSIDVHGGPFWTNQRLSDERARWVAYQLRFAGLKDAIVDVIGHAAFEPLPGFGPDILARNRRVELRLVNRGAMITSADPAASAAPAAPPRGPNPSLPPLRSEAERSDDQRRTIVAGPGVTVFAPVDGAVLPSDRVFVGVRGEPGATVVLFDGAARLADGQVRGDGVHDFIAVPLARGPHRLRVQMTNSWQQTRWDSLTVHVSGRPARLLVDGAPSRVVLAAGGQSNDTVRVRVRDQWNVPVVTGAFVTVASDGAEIVSADEDHSSVGVQVKADSSGAATLVLRGGREVRRGSLVLRSGAANVRVPLEILAAVQSFMMTATGQVGVGASPDAFGSATARGRLDSRTAVLVSIDSRQLDAGRDDFGRSVDPLDEAQYPILGDASSTRTRSASRYAVAARIERGLDWLALGDLTTGGFAGGLALSGYDRALSGVAGRVTTGAVVWQGFGSTSSQRLAQLQIRGAGMSGPYDLGLGLNPGTERVALETRAYDDAQQMLARQVLVRYVDYQIDYEHGLLLFKQPVPATDPSGNPVFIMVTYETDNGGAESTVWGVRAAADARALVGHDVLDSLRIGSTFISDGRPGAQRELAGVDFGVLRTGRIALRGELAHSATPDSAGFATTVDGTLMLAKGRVAFSGAWLHTDREFRNPANVALAGGTEDLKLGARFAVGSSELRFEHSLQQFDLQSVSRSRSGAFVAQRFGNGAFRAEAGVTATRLNTGTGDDANQASELKLTWSPLAALTFSADARYHLGDVASQVQPDYVGGGVRLKVNQHTSFELTHRQVALPNGPGYAVTSLGGRSDLTAGTQAWGSYQIAGANAAHAAAVMGLNNRLRLGTEWTVNTMFERRMGLDRAPTADPLRALPFTQVEENYWSAGLGADWLPEQKPYRFSMRSEFRDGAERSSRLVTLGGEASLTKAFALLTRQEYLASDDRAATGRMSHERLSSLSGLAFRPVGSDALNLLAKLELIDEQNPLGGGVLTAQTGHEARRIATAEAIWSPAARVELAARYSLRRTDATVTHTDSTVQPLSSSADYMGARLDVGFAPWVAVRGEGRLLYERTSGSKRWDAAPQLVLMPVRGMEIAGGYRMGDLRDPDFAVRGGAGWFVTFGATVTEQSVAGLAGFWRARLNR